MGCGVRSREPSAEAPPARSEETSSNTEAASDEDSQRSSSPKMRDAEMEKLRAENARLLATIAKMQGRIDALEEQLRDLPRAIWQFNKDKVSASAENSPPTTTGSESSQSASGSAATGSGSAATGSVSSPSSSASARSLLPSGSESAGNRPRSGNRKRQRIGPAPGSEDSEDDTQRERPRTEKSTAPRKTTANATTAPRKTAANVTTAPREEEDSQEEMEINPFPTNESERQTAVHGSSRTSSPEPPTGEPTTATTKKNAIPPVYLVRSQRWTAVQREMAKLKIAVIKAKTNYQGVAIYVETANDFRRLVKMFRETKEEFFTYSLKEEKPLRVVVRGVPSGVSEAEVTADLKAQGFNPVSITRMKSRKDRQAMPLVLVQVPQEEQEILKVTRCCHLVVRVEVQRPPTEPSQCHRCQRYGHGQSRCTAKPRCVKCAGDHHSGDCKKSRDSRAKCANCAGDHPASYRGCPQCPKTLRKTAPPAPPAPQTPRELTQPAPRPAPPKPQQAKNATYAGVTGKKTTPISKPASEQSEGNSVVDVLKDADKLQDLLTLMRQLSAIFSR